MPLRTFEEITKELQPHEQLLARKVYEYLRGNQDKWITANQLSIYALDYPANKPMSGARMRKMIQFLRCKLANATIEKSVPMIIAGSKGYMLTRNIKVQDDHIVSLKQRISQIQVTLDAQLIVHNRQLMALQEAAQTQMELN